MSNPNAERHLGALEQITMRALEKKPENRYQSMQELIEDLDRVSGGGRPRALTPATPSPALADALEPRSKSEMNLEDQIAGTGGVAGKKRWMALGAAAVLLLGALGLFLGLRGGEPGASVAPAPPPLAPAASSVPPPAPAPPAVPVPPSVPAPSTAQAPVEDVVLGAVTVKSVPGGATLVLDGAIVGTTPAMFPKPKSGSRTLELRLDGYQRETLLINPQTQSVLEVALRKRVQAAKAPKTAPAPAPRAQEHARPRTRTGSEVVDPWAN
jgi:serine/threonine-protein kinase